MSSEVIDKTINTLGDLQSRYDEILTPEAMEFLAKLHRHFNPQRIKLLAARKVRQEEIENGKLPDFLAKTEAIRSGDWQIGELPADLQKRNVEITGPVSRKMIINALNSGADCFMADFEDSNSPTWENTIEGQLNLKDAINRQIGFTASNGKTYDLNEKVAVLMVRPRGWHLEEKHIEIDGELMSASLVDFGLYFFHNAKSLVNKGSGPYFYLPKLESHLEARLWNDVFVFAQNELGVKQGTVKVTVLVETILAVFEMHEIIYELKDHMAGLNAGRWDYIFSAIKKFKKDKSRIFPDRSAVTMKVPFMSKYAQLLVQTCHQHGAHAMGGMSAFIPSKDEKVNEQAFAKVKEDKRTEASQGYDGTWVAHPGLVNLAVEEFQKVLKGNVHQKEVMRKDVSIRGSELIDFTIENAVITEEGLRTNINVGILYIESWLRGIGAAALYNLMEDAATAEISRAQVWQWIQHKCKTDDGQAINIERVSELVTSEVAKIQEMIGAERFEKGRFIDATALFLDLVGKSKCVDFLTIPAYKKLK